MTPNRGISLLFAVTLAACSAAPESDASRTSSTHQAIVGGTLSTTADDAVVRLDLGTGFCSGTLVTPNLVLTARHCLANLDETQECGNFSTNLTPSSISVTLGVQAANTTAVAKGKQVFVETQASSCGFDIGLLLLDRDIPNAKVAKVRTTALQQGEPARTVGYGDDGSGQVTAGRFVRTGLSVEGVGPNTFVWQTDQGQQIQVPVASGELVTGESTCFGDSGGPLFDGQGAIIGVTSRGVDQSCIDRPSIFSGTTTHVDLINTAAKASGHALGSTSTAPSSTTPGTNNKPSTSGNTSSSGGDDGSFEDDPSTSGSKSPRAQLDSGNVASSGCSASARHSSDPVLAGLIAGAALLILGRRRVKRAVTAARTLG